MRLTRGRTVGCTTPRKGYVDGILLDNGRAKDGVGGGTCQLANLLHWMVLYSPLTLTGRSDDRALGESEPA